MKRMDFSMPDQGQSKELEVMIIGNKGNFSMENFAQFIFYFHLESGNNIIASPAPQHTQRFVRLFFNF